MKVSVVPLGPSLEGTVEEIRNYLLACPAEARAVLFPGQQVLLSKASLEQATSTMIETATK